MNIRNISADVRIVNYGDPFNFEHDIVVEAILRGAWTVVWKTNSLSNDFAYTEAIQVANSAAHNLLNRDLPQSIAQGDEP